MPAPVGEDAGAAAGCPLRADAGRGGPVTWEPPRKRPGRRMSFASLRLGPRDEGAAAPVVPEARG